MATITWGSFNPRKTSNIKKLSLDKDEQVRACFLESHPQVAYVHNFEKVITGPDGRPVIIKDTWPSGDPREKAKTEYAGKFACLGDEEELERSGADPENCPACRASIDEPNAVQKPRMRVLGHVLKYSTKPGSFTLSKPFSANLLVWDLTENRFAELNDIFAEHGELSKLDLLLGPCDNKQMQNYKIQVGRDEAAWRADKDRIQFVDELFSEERVEDLATVAAKRPSVYEMKNKVDEVVRAYRHAYGLPSETGSYDSLLESSNVNSVAAAVDAAEDATEEAEEAPKRMTTSKRPKVQEEPETSDEDATGDDDPEDSDEVDVTASLEDILSKF